MPRVLRYAIGALAVLAVLCLALVVADARVLIYERVVEPGEHYHVQGFGDVGTKAQATLVCTYFTGRSVKTTVMWYASNNVMGRDSCPFLKGSD